MRLMKKQETEAHVSLPLQVTEAASGKDGTQPHWLKSQYFSTQAVPPSKRLQRGLHLSRALKNKWDFVILSPVKWQEWQGNKARWRDRGTPTRQRASPACHPQGGSHCFSDENLWAPGWFPWQHEPPWCPDPSLSVSVFLIGLAAAHCLPD